MKNFRKFVSLLLVLCLGLTLCACGKKEQDLWSTALYTEDTELGEGEKTVYVTIEAGEKSILLTIHTHCDILGEALLGNNIISGEQGEFGMYIKAANGISADYDVNQSYWAFYQKGEYMMNGVDTTEISGGEEYELVYSK